MGRYLPHSVLIEDVSDTEVKIIQLFGKTIENLLAEKLILSASAVLYAIDQHVSEISIREELKAGFWEALRFASGESRTVQQLLSIDERVISMYSEAAIMDSLNQGQFDELARLTVLELTYAERLVGEEEYEEEKLQQLVHLVTEVPRMLWITQINGVVTTLDNEGVLKPH